jgi:hypothetical protein
LSEYIYLYVCLVFLNTYPLQIDLSFAVMRNELFRNILVLRKIQLKPMSTLQKTNDNKQILKIDVTSDNICRE